MRKGYLFRVLIVLGLLFIGFAIKAHAGGVVTDCSTFGDKYITGTLRASLEGGGDITFSCDGTINVVPAFQIKADTHIDANGHNVVLSGNNTNTVFIIRKPSKLDLIGLTITGGTVYGGLRNIGGTVTLTNCIVSGNTGSQAGGIYNEGWTGTKGMMNLINTTISDNSCPCGTGGGIFNAASGTMTLTNSTVTRNNAPRVNNCSFGSGGGICNLGSMTLTDSNVTDNTAYSRGGIYNNGSGQLTLVRSTVSGNSATGAEGGGISHCCDNTANITLINSTVSGNIAAGKGGGINAYGGIIKIENSTVANNTSVAIGGGILNSVDAVLTITNSTISGNSANSNNTGSYGLGGGIYNFGGPVSITNSTISGNSAARQGGGIYNFSPLTLTNVTFYGNSAPGGSNLYLANSVNAATQITNTLIANGQGSGNCVDGLRVIIDGGFNMVSDGTCNLTESSSLSNTDPLLDSTLNYNGGLLTMTHALLSGSPAIDRIPCGVNGCGDSITTDQRGVTRPQGSYCDVGAYEKVFVAQNNPSLLSSVANKTVNVGEPLVITVVATDPDNDPLVYSADFLPYGAIFDPATHTFAWTPGPDQTGTYSVRFSVSDGKSEVSEDVSITVNAVNPPLADLTGEWSGTLSYKRGTTKGTFVVRNIGTLKAGKFSVAYYLSTDGSLAPGNVVLIGTKNIRSLAAGDSISLDFSYKGSTTGKYVIAVVDSGDNIEESSEENNFILYSNLQNL